MPDNPYIATEDMVERMAFWLCERDQCDPHQLIWSGQPPEPEGEVWHVYIPEARRALEVALTPYSDTPPTIEAT